MAKTIKTLAGPIQLPLIGAILTLFTVPAVTKYIVRNIHVQNPTGVDATLTLSKGVDAAGTRLYDALVIPANTAQDFFGLYEYPAAQVMQGYSGTSNVLVITVSGEIETL